MERHVEFRNLLFVSILTSRCRSHDVCCLQPSSAHAQHPPCAELRQAHFRTMSPSNTQSQTALPQTGLGILMNHSKRETQQGTVQPGHRETTHQGLSKSITTSSAFHSLSPQQQSQIQEDLVDRERQASSLAAAGMVAERVSLIRPAAQPPVGHVLQAPPPLVGIAPPSPSRPEVAMEGINWNMVELGSNLVDDMDMDFATLFDPEREQAHMQTVGTAWPVSSNTAGTSVAIPAPMADQVSEYPLQLCSASPIIPLIPLIPLGVSVTRASLTSHGDRADCGMFHPSLRAERNASSNRPVLTVAQVPVQLSASLGPHAVPVVGQSDVSTERQHIHLTPI
jgi:hypothetical protein